MDLADLGALVSEHRAAFEHPIAPMRIGSEVIDTDRAPVVMGAINLSRDSTYRESIAVSSESAIRKAKVMVAQGAHLIDLGAESTTANAARVDVREQLIQLEPIALKLSELAVPVSIESYNPRLAEGILKAGASVINYTGAGFDDEMFEVAARFGATIIICFQPGATARDIGEVPLDHDPIPVLLDHFGPRVELARSHGVSDIVIDPGLGFYYSNLVEPRVRVAYQTRVLLHGFRLRVLGYPVAQALPHAFTLFEDEFRIAEAQFALFARLARTGLLRTHEVAKVNATLRLLELSVPNW